ncbi:hypothetical protein QOT17_010554 [Balamuthia mandrillaris]
MKKRRRSAERDAIPLAYNVLSSSIARAPTNSSFSSSASPAASSSTSTTFSSAASGLHQLSPTAAERRRSQEERGNQQLLCNSPDKDNSSPTKRKRTTSDYSQANGDGEDCQPQSEASRLRDLRLQKHLELRLSEQRLKDIVGHRLHRTEQTLLSKLESVLVSSQRDNKDGMDTSRAEEKEKGKEKDENPESATASRLQILEMQQHIREATKKNAELFEELSQTRAKLSSITQLEDERTERITALQLKANEAEDAVEELESSMTQLRHEMEKLKRQLNEADQVAEYWRNEAQFYKSKADSREMREEMEQREKEYMYASVEEAGAERESDERSVCCYSSQTASATQEIHLLSSLLPDENPNSTQSPSLPSFSLSTTPDDLYSSQPLFEIKYVNTEGDVEDNNKEAEKEEEEEEEEEEDEDEADSSQGTIFAFNGYPRQIIKSSLICHFFEQWTAMLAENHQHVVYLDGFAGWGKYYINRKCVDGTALQLIGKRSIPRGTTVSMILVEKARQHFHNLVKSIQDILGKPPTWLQEKTCAFFESTSGSTLRVTVLRSACERCLPVVYMYPPSIPAFVFLDPNGYKDYPRTFIDSLRQHFRVRCDTIVNFMSSSIHRTRTTSEASLKELIFPAGRAASHCPFNSPELERMEELECLEHYAVTYYNAVNQFSEAPLIYPVRHAVRFDSQCYPHQIRQRCRSTDCTTGVHTITGRNERLTADLLPPQFSESLRDNKDKVKDFVEEQTPFLWHTMG